MKNPNGSILFIVGICIGAIIVYMLVKPSPYSLLAKSGSAEGFQDGCNQCNQAPCRCRRDICPPCPRQPDLSQYVLKASVPPCPTCPDMSKYMLKTECPPVPDLSKYVLKSSIPRQGPVVLDCSKCQKPKGDCPPCPRPRCPEVKCPEPTKCEPCAPCPRPICPAPKIQCKAQDMPQSTVRPYMAPLNVSTFGS
jgi:hypothetical protein